jgi:hypothetical protein
MVCAQVVKTRTKKPIYISIARGIKSSPSVPLMYDCILYQITIIVACVVVVVDIHYTIFVQVESAMTTTTSIKLQKPSLVIRISIHHQMWWGKKWENSLWTCAPLSKTIVMIIPQNVLWVVLCSLPQGHQSKWVPRLSMVWPHWHYERWATIECGKPRHVCSVVRKWVEDKWNSSVVGWPNNQTPTPRPTHE